MAHPDLDQPLGGIHHTLAATLTAKVIQQETGVCVYNLTRTAANELVLKHLPINRPEVTNIRVLLRNGPEVIHQGYIYDRAVNFYLVMVEWE